MSNSINPTPDVQKLDGLGTSNTSIDASKGGSGSTNSTPIDAPNGGSGSTNSNKKTDPKAEDSSNKPIDKPKKSLSFLQEAALEVALEESQTSTDLLLHAADEIARERGLASPLKKRGEFKYFEDTLEDSITNGKVKVIDANGSVSYVDQTSVPATIAMLSDDAAALLKQFNIEEPKDPVDGTSIADLPPRPKQSDEVNEVLERNSSPNKAKALKERFLAERAEYLRKKRSKGTVPGNSVSRDRHGDPVVSQSASQIAMLLRQSKERLSCPRCSEPQPHDRCDVEYEHSHITRKLLSKVMTPAQEQLFLNGSQLKRLDTAQAKTLAKRSSDAKGDSKGGPPTPRTGHRKSTSDLYSSTACRASVEALAEDYEDKATALRKSNERTNRPKGLDYSALFEGDSKSETARSYRHMLFDDAKNCTFKPTIKKNPNAETSAKNADDDNEAKEQFKFMERQEAVERKRRKDIETAAGMAAYDALVDKLYCPSCGSKQKYDEYKERKKKCPICNVDYCRKITWNQVSRRFLEKEKQHVRRVREKIDMLAKELAEIDNVVEVKRFNSRSGLTETLIYEDGLPRGVWTPEVEEAFFKKLKENEAKKKLRIEELVKELTHSFKPTIKTKLGAEEDDFDWDANERNRIIVEQFVERVDEDLDYRRNNLPHWQQREKLYVDTYKFKV